MHIALLVKQNLPVEITFFQRSEFRKYINYAKLINPKATRVDLLQAI